MAGLITKFIWFCLIPLLILFMLHMRKFRNPYKLTMFIGKKGSGKTTMIMKYALHYQKKGIPCYCSVPMPGCYLFDPKKLGKFAIEPNAVIFIDEASLLWDNRNYKTFSDDLKAYFRYQRQYRHKVFLFSQAFDVDLKLRNLCDELYIIRNIANVFSVARRVEKNITVLSARDDGVQQSAIVDDLHYSSLIFAPFGGMKLTYIPKYSKYFKSFDPPTLTSQDYYLEPPFKKQTWKEALNELRGWRPHKPKFKNKRL